MPQEGTSSGSWDYAFGREWRAAADSCHELEGKPHTWATQSTNPVRFGMAGAQEEEGGGHSSLFRPGHRAKAVREADTGNEQLPTNKFQARQ